ncbi:hypothetical protein A5712_12835 [Mycobacterium sp. E2327]|uniref:BTAD domain-containing putative transcriptional regulator n=1 Tax=Mycobacterium sp. E2327 TaxID=1834132 RepID=UPI0007FC89EA|nr:BTAD domain-containing putative transcriptional regulator [Mycobacterium sp. E2327]OBI22318.1 hypothetical protein A5712_12835 [Mycobacterium sp. E2327]
MELGVLGPLQVRRAGAPVTIPGAKPRAILTMLGLHVGSVVSADALVELLWGEDPPRTAAKALQTHISSLRRTLGDGFVLTEGAGWTLADSEVDASRYKSAARRGRDAAAAGDTGQAVARFEEALELWRGIPELPDGRRGTSEKTRWIEGHAALVEDRADALLATGRAAEIIGELEAAVADAPLRERRWAQLMLALYRAGRQGEALGAYQRARTLLAEELGVDPGPELRRLEAAIVAQDAALETPGAQNVPSVTRAVTFLLTDIEGSTAAWEADAGAMGVALARHDELVEQVVTSRGGRLIKTRGEGDATFSVFERPSAAAAAALELQDAIMHEPWALREPMRVRVALHTGEAEFRDGDYFGRAVNRAARLRSLAAGGQILCSGATAELVIDSLPDDVVLADLGTRQLRNLARPEHVFELRPETAEERSEEVPGEAPLERPDLPAVLAGPGPFVGRGRELERLFSAWQTALVGGTNAVLIAGEPGVGKTRLAGEWSRQAYDQGALVIYGRCDEDLGAPYQPFAEALRSLVPCLGSSRLRELRGVEALLPLVPGLTDVLPDLAAPTRADPDTERYALFDAVVALLGVASASAPVVLILDDLHWAAKPTLLLLRHLLRFGERARVQIIGTYRSTDLDRSHPLSAMLADLHRDGTANRLQLSGLDEDDVSAYVAEVGYNDEELARALASVTGGNPFFLIEALRHVEESGGRWDPSTLPQGVREAVSRRLSRLSPETNKALAAAAVVGSRFALELVERVVGDDLVDPLDEACKAGIVIEEPGGRYRFNHALVRQSLLAELPSVRRMRLHQRIATTLENEPGADDELLAELAHHYFECAWAGNAVKAVEYCRRAADQAMARLAYEGAADLYDRALHALEEIDDELPDRDDQIAELLIARCEALLAAGDVTSAAGAVSQLQGTTVNSARLAAWATCFDGQLSMLTDPERLDEVEAAVGAAAAKLAEIDDAAGEAKAHTVRAGCLARLGRIGDCEVALDDALTAARRAREHRRVNAVLANAPLAALWGPNPVPRAGGRCLDVVRLLRITTDSPAVEATSTRCQAVLEAFRGRAAAARRMIDSARRTVTELGLRHVLVEVEQFAGIVELVVDNPEAAEPHLRKAYNGFRRMGLDADTAETAALLGRTCLLLDREAEADELCSESERLAGHALKASIAWRTLRARLLSRSGDHGAARRVAEEAVSLAERTDALVDHGDACLSLATVLAAGGDAAGARAAAERAVGLYERKGAAALAEKARRILGEHRPGAAPTQSEPPTRLEPDNECARVIRRGAAAIDRAAWDEFERLFASEIVVESRRKITGGFTRDFSPSEARLVAENGAMRIRISVIDVRGERLALVRLEIGTADVSPGAPRDEMLGLAGINHDGRISLEMFFDVEDIDAARAELDAAHARFGEEQPRALRLENAVTRVHERVQSVTEAPPEAPSIEPDNAAVRVGERVMAAVHCGAWEEFEQFFAPDISIENRRKVVGLTLPSELWRRGWRREVETSGMRVEHVMVAARGDRLALARMWAGTEDVDPGAPYDELLHLYAIDDDGRVALQIFFDVEDIDAAIAELDALAARFEEDAHRPRRLENAAAQVFQHVWSHFAAGDWAAVAATVADNYSGIDRRRVVNAGTQYGRDSVINDLQAAAEVGFTISMVSAIAVRGERLVLARVRASGRDPEAIQNDALNVVEIDAAERIATTVTFDLEDFDAAIAELDARYLAGEAAPHAHVWSGVAAVFAALRQHEMSPTTPDFVDVDRRRLAVDTGGFEAYLRAIWDVTDYVSVHITAVHRLTALGAVVTHASHAISHDGLYAEWQNVNLLTFDGDLLSRVELFDEADLDAALARFEELQPQTRRLENAASRVLERYFARFAARDWGVMAETLTDDFLTDDRRRVVNAGVRRGRDAEIANMQSFAGIGIINIAPTTIATRGERLVLCRHDVSFRDWAEPYDVISVVEITDTQISAHVMFDADDIDAAVEELDTRYLAGDAAANGQTWSVIAGAYTALNQHEIAATTPDFASTDYRRGAKFAPGDLIANVRATWDLAQNGSTYIEAVHRLTFLGAVVTHVTRGSSVAGFDAEWREVFLLTVDGDLLSRCELFDESDLDSAIVRFEQLSRPVPRLENEASQAVGRLLAHFSTRDWDALAELVSDDFYGDDRRPVLSAGTQRGRDAMIRQFQTAADLEITQAASDPVATRGDRLILTCIRFARIDEEPDAFRVDLLYVVETNSDSQISALIAFDSGDFDAAIQELDARYLTGEAAAHARTWSVLMQAYAALNRHEMPSTTPDWVNVDHRRGASFASGEMPALLDAAWNLTTDLRHYIEAVHRLNDLGAVVTNTSHETSHDGFDAEWRVITIGTVEGDMLSRTEVFDEADLEAAIARFDELTQQAPRLENVATQVYDRGNMYLANRDWAALAATMADNVIDDDRRRMANAGVRCGRDAVIAGAQTAAALGAYRTALTTVAIRGDRLALCRLRYSGRDQSPEAFYSEALGVIEIDADARVVAHVTFDFEDLDAAVAELDARYLAGEAAAHAHTWSVISEVYAALNRNEMPAATPDLVDIDHRALSAIGSGDLMAYLRTSLEDTEDTPRNRIYIEAVHQLTDLGAVTTHVAKSTSREGFEAEWRITSFFIVDGDAINRYEIYDDADVDAAITRFEQLSRPLPRLENAASRMYDRFNTYLAARDWDAMVEMITDDICSDDRRRVVSAGIQRGRDAQTANLRAIVDVGVKNFESSVIATRGERLVLTRARVSGDERPEAFGSELLSVIEIDNDNRIAAGVLFDLDDLEAAFEELDARYLAGEAAAHLHTWSVIARICPAFNRKELFAITPDPIYIDHRPLVSIEGADLPASIRAVWDLTSKASVYIEAVHQLSERGAVFTEVLNMTSREGFDAEVRMIMLFTVEGDLISGVEVFDEADFDAALARFDELHQQARRLANVASHVDQRFWALFASREWDAMAELLAADVSTDDRRRVVNAGALHGRNMHIESMQTLAKLGAKVTSEIVAIRGAHLALTHLNRQLRPGQWGSELLYLIQIGTNHRLAAGVFFDPDDFDAAFEELENRYLAGEAADQAPTWSAVKAVYSALNRHEHPALTRDSVCIDHRPLVPVETADLATWIREVWDLTPDLSNYVENVHRLSNCGAVLTHAARGTSQAGFSAEWRLIAVLQFEVDQIARLEVFDEAEIGAALARFDELQPRAQRLENAAGRIVERFQACFSIQDWVAIAELLADDMVADDRRRVVNAGLRHGRDLYVADVRAAVDVGAETITTRVIATRGERLVLTHVRAVNRGFSPDEVGAEWLCIVEIGADERIVAMVVFDPDDIDAAYAEFDARYLTGEAAAHAHTWSLVARAYAALNRRQLPEVAADWVNIDHRRLAPIPAGGLSAYLLATWDLSPQSGIRIEAVHRLSKVGAVVTQVVKGTSHQGFQAEWRTIDLSTYDGEKIKRTELFDEDDLDAALARFDELNRPRPLENNATRTWSHMADATNRRDMEGFLALTAADLRYEDRRQGLRGEFEGPERHKAAQTMFESLPINVRVTADPIAIRGSRLTLIHICYRDTDFADRPITVEFLQVAEVDDRGLMLDCVSFDPDDTNAAFEELDARYLAGEAAAHAQTWSVAMQAYAAANRHELPGMTPNSAFVDHRPGVTTEAEDLAAYLPAVWDLIPDISAYIEAVHRLSEFGCVITHAARGTSHEGFDAEWRTLNVLTVEGDLLNRVEVYDQADLNAALARFEELNRPG